VGRGGELNVRGSHAAQPKIVADETRQPHITLGWYDGWPHSDRRGVLFELIVSVMVAVEPLKFRKSRLSLKSALSIPHDTCADVLETIEPAILSRHTIGRNPRQPGCSRLWLEQFDSLLGGQSLNQLTPAGGAFSAGGRSRNRAPKNAAC
jgi:hypothetical protein